MPMHTGNAFAVAQESIKTRFGELSFTHGFANGYPTVVNRYDERDFQHACL